MNRIEYPVNLQNEMYLGTSSDQLLNIDICGWKPRKSMPEYTRRYNGRIDWQIIYIHGGYAYFQIEDTVKKAGPYTLVVFPPGVPQLYVYYPKECPIANYVHFSGKIVPEIMEKFRLTDKIFYNINPLHDDEIVEMFLNLQNKFTLHKSDESMCWGLLIDIISKFSQFIYNENKITDKSNTKYNSAMIEILEEINNNYNSDRAVEDYARQVHLSPSYFAHIFKQTTGFSPIQYKSILRINNAKNLLLTTTESIENISYELGYTNIAMFSKKFKEVTGISPSAYRKAYQKE